jgi:hypothetical protein
MEYGNGTSGATYYDSLGEVMLYAPQYCFPQASVCPVVGNQVNIRLRPLSAGPATLTVTLIDIGT